MRKLVSASLTASLLGAPAALAGEMEINVEIPRLNVAEYHRPYVALWIETPDHKAAANLDVWYDLALPDKEGTEWLKDMRQWWRRTGRTLDMPVDGISSATKAPGAHQLKFSSDAAPLADLPPGEYRLVIEASREVGGRELLRLPFQWPPEEAAEQTVEGEHELGAVRLTLKP
ncbi:DUF2271 domain-containing protein [Tepidicaulis sp. LMO-SS28]|uniref:DUF2271 domain-containing protein n=1 Tax=Tepidicaulis sp. LMO-SS28 TaxID=3447455 RepID=UPI003EE081D3